MNPDPGDLVQRLPDEAFGGLPGPGEPAAEDASGVAAAEVGRDPASPKLSVMITAAVATTLLQLLIVVLVLDALTVLPLGATFRLLGLAAAAVLVGALVVARLRQATSVRSPTALPRAIGFGIAATLITAGLGSARLLLDGVDAGPLITAIVLVTAGIAVVTLLAVTRKNRAKTAT